MSQEYSEIELKSYNYDTKETEIVGTVSTYTLSRSIKAGHIARLLEDWLNCFDSEVKRGEEIGKFVTQWHRTLQGNLVNFCISILVGYAREYEKRWGGYTDARNEVAYRAAKEVLQGVENGSIPFQPLI